MGAPKGNKYAVGNSGRPSGYKPEFAKQALGLCKLGATDAELADYFEVTIPTIRAWSIENKEFFSAKRIGKVEYDERVERALFTRATGYSYDAVKIFMPAGATEPVYAPYREHVPPDSTAMIFWLKNRKRAEWRDKQDHEHTGPDGGAVRHEIVMTVVDPKAK